MKEKGERPIINATTRRRAGAKSLGVELDLSGGISRAKHDKIRFGWRKGSAYYFGREFQTERRFGNVWAISQLWRVSGYGMKLIQN